MANGLTFNTAYVSLFSHLSLLSYLLLCLSLPQPLLTVLQVAVSLSVGTIMTSDVNLQVPIMIYAPQLEALMESHGAALIGPDGEKVADGEFCFPADSGNHKEDAAKQLAPGQSLSGSVFYRNSNGFYIDIANTPGIGELSLVLDVTANADIGVHGRYGSEPTVLEWDVSEAPQSEGKWTLALNRYSVPRLSPGRWFFAILGKSLLQTSDYEIKYSLQVSVFAVYIFCLSLTWNEVIKAVSP